MALDAFSNAFLDIDLRYCFFVIMGGFQVSIAAFKPGPQATLAPVPDIVALAPGGVVELARLGRFIPMQAERIDDKSKANPFQKGLVFLQILWMVVQCCARAAAGAPITLLEVHTMVHVLCAMLLYLFWLKVRSCSEKNEPCL